MRYLVILYVLLLGGVMSDNTVLASPKVSAKIKFLYRMANDPVAVYDFYCNHLGLKCAGSGENGYVEVSMGDVSILFFKSDYEIKTPSEFAWQPGYEGSNANLNSLSIQYSSLEDFKAVFNNISESGTPMLYKKPQWRRDSYWGLTVRDPMNTTLELYFIPKNKPKATTW